MRDILFLSYFGDSVCTCRWSRARLTRKQPEVQEFFSRSESSGLSFAVAVREKVLFASLTFLHEQTNTNICTNIF